MDMVKVASDLVLKSDHNDSKLLLPIAPKLVSFIRIKVRNKQVPLLPYEAGIGGGAGLSTTMASAFFCAV